VVFARMVERDPDLKRFSYYSLLESEVTMRRSSCGAVAVCILLVGHAIGGPVVLDDFEDLSGWKTYRGRGSLDKADTAAVGSGAIRVTFPGMVFKKLPPRPEREVIPWDGSAGLSFWVKGDGSDLFGCLAVSSDRGRFPYVYYFPLKNTEWHQHKVSWEEFAPEGERYTLGSKGALPPSGIGGLRFGNRWTIHRNNERLPKHSYCIDQVQIEDEVPKPVPAPEMRPFADVADLLRTRKKIHVVCMGDSITAGSGLADKDNERYATVIQRVLRARLGYEDIIVESRAVGGAKLTDARAWTRRDFRGEPPDLVTILYGYNDKKVYTCAYFKDSLNDYIDRIARVTDGKTAVLLLSTIPGTKFKFVMLDDFADAVRQTARERGLACFDLDKVIKAIGRVEAEKYFADMAHPNKEGHEVIGKAIAGFLLRSAGVAE